MAAVKSCITIDGGAGEGGGQIVRTSLALSLVTGRPVHIERVRAGRKKPGLLRQHLTAVEAALAVGGGRAEGATLGSRELRFEPGAVSPGSHRFAVGTAGSATLVLQTVLPALLLASGPSRLVLEGGTHNPFAPPFDFLHRAFLPLLGRMGPRVDAVLERHGFYPAGGGRFRVSVEPAPRLEPIELLERGAILRKRARALFSSLPHEIAKRELKALATRITLEPDECRPEEIKDATGPGNILILELECERITEVFCGFGQRGVPAERVAQETAEQAREYLAAGVPVGPYLADQLLLPLALAGGGAFRTMPPTRHTLTNAEVIRRFLDVDIRFTREEGAVHRIEVGQGRSWHAGERGGSS